MRRAWRGFDLSWLGSLGLVVLFDDRVPELRWFALFFLVYPLQWVRGLVRLVLWNRRRPRNLPPLTLGRVVLYGVSLCLALFNPWIFVQSLLMAAGQLLAGFRTALRPPQRNAMVNLAPPLTGVWAVARGGADADSSHSWGIPNQRYAYDLICHRLTDESGRSHGGERQAATGLLRLRPPDPRRGGRRHGAAARRGTSRSVAGGNGPLRAGRAGTP